MTTDSDEFTMIIQAAAGQALSRSLAALGAFAFSVYQAMRGGLLVEMEVRQ